MTFTDIPEVANRDLILSKVPRESAKLGRIFRFALTFNGYEYWGSDKCGHIANKRMHNTLTELRTCLFFEQRRYRHFGHPPDTEDEQYIRSLICKIREMIVSGRVD